jgi:3-methyladenine DNA glycosylase AlkC
MATQLKDFFDARVIQTIADELRSVYPDLKTSAFVRDCLAGLDRLELMDRGAHIASMMHEHLPRSFSRAARILIKSLGPEPAAPVEEGGGMAPFKYLPHVLFVARYGLDDLEVALQAQHELTRRFTAEFSIRAFLVKHPQATYERLRRWASDPSVHVRRLVSEGSRPRLPWAQRLRAYQEDPTPVIALLELLKDDPERYVQRSVANNLNDISKDHPEVAVDVCRRWLVDATPGRRWIVQHALRSLVKQGHRGGAAAAGRRRQTGRAGALPVVVARSGARR